MNDEQLIKRFTSGSDDKAFGLLVERYINVAYAAAINYLGNEDLARDACQLTFVKFSKKAGKLSGKVQLGGWIHATARNMARNIQKAETRRRKREESYADELMRKPTSETDWAQLGPELHEALVLLKPADRDAVILRFFQNKNLAEVGTALGISADAARMRLNRALEHMGDRLSKKGITSTAAALASALPAHAALTAPTGLASTISIAVLTGTTVSTTATLTGVIITAMKAKAIIISTAVAATALVSTGVYLSNKTENAPAENQTESLVDAIENTAPPEASQAERSVTEAQPNVSDISSAETPGEAVQTSVATTAVATSSDGATLGISPKHLRQAEQLVGMMEMAFPLMENDMMKTAIAGQVENPSKKLSVRLGLDPETEKEFSAILTAHAESESSRTLEQTTGMMDSMKQMVEDDREAAVNYMALESMKDAGETLSPEQRTYTRKWKRRMKKSFNMEDDEQAEPRQWYEDENVLGELNELLTEPQQDELLTHVVEKEERALERRAYDRSSELANTLGLNEADRSALYDYLYENPDASNNDISEQLAPELRSLMPTGLDSLFPISKGVDSGL